MKYAIAAAIAVLGLSVATAEAAPVASSEVLAKAASSDAVQKVWYHGRWRSHHRYGSGWHNRWRSHHRWGSHW